MATSIEAAARGACQEKGCREKSGLMFYAQEKKVLCSGCAGKRGCDLPAKWFCAEHTRQEIKSFCKDHNKAVCHLCAVIEHQTPDCNLISIVKAVGDVKEKLLNAKGRLRESNRLWGKYSVALGQSRDLTEKHLSSLQHDVNAFLDEGVKRENEKEESEKRKINKEAEELIKKINERREEQLKRAHEDGEKRRRPIHDKRRALLDELEDIINKAHAKIGEMTMEARKIMKITDEASQTMEHLLIDERDLLMSAQHLMTSLDGTLKKTPDESAIGGVTKTLTNVAFERGTSDERYTGRFVGYDKKWELVDYIEIPPHVKEPFLVGCVDEDQVIISEKITSNTYSLNVTSRGMGKVLTCGQGEDIMSCTCLDEDAIVCSKYKEGCTGESLNECISVFDGQWRLKKDISIPRNTSGLSNTVLAYVGSDGLIRAAQSGQSKVYVIDPTNEKLTNTIACEQGIKLRGVLSTGDIVAQTKSDLMIIDRKGRQTKIAPSHWYRGTVGVDTVTDYLYHLQYDRERKMCVVDELSSTGELRGSGIISFPLASGCEFKSDSRVVITPLGKLIVTNRKDCLIFKERFTFMFKEAHF